MPNQSNYRRSHVMVNRTAEEKLVEIAKLEDLAPDDATGDLVYRRRVNEILAGKP